jgi:rhamnulokinase
MSSEDNGSCFLAIDLGAGSGRAVLGRFAGEMLAIEEVHRFQNGATEVRGVMYWDALGLYNEIVEGIRKGAALAGGRLSGIGIDTWGVDFGLLDEQGKLISNPVHYRDARTDGVMDRVFEIAPREDVFKTTGIQFLQFNTLYQLAAMRFKKWPELDRARTLLMMPDLMNYFLCGTKVSEFTIATTTQFYDPNKGGWANEMLEKLEIPTAILPEIAPPGTVLGALDGEAARAAGEVPVIAPACHDTGSAVAAVPADPHMDQGAWAYISSGTWSLMGIEVKEPIINAKALEHNFTNEGGVGGTYRFLKNIAGMWLLEECRRVWAEKEGRERSYEELFAEAEEAEPFRSLVDPDHHSFLRPENMPAAITRLCKESGQPEPDTRGRFTRCILESLALKYRTVRDAIEEVSGKKIQALHVVGGGSQNRLLNQYTADALGIPVLAGPVEATAIGNIVVQAVAARVVTDLSTAREFIRKSFPVKVYEPKQAEI